MAAFTSAAGLFVKDIYRDNEFVQTAWCGNDWVTLVVIVPAFYFILFAAGGDTLKLQLLWMGLISYLVYNYAFYLFGAAFNNLFLVYVAIFSVSLFALISGLSSFSAYQISSASKAVRWVSIYLLLIAVMLCIVELPSIFDFITDAKTPDIIQKTNYPTSVVYALDLSLVVPVMILAAVLLWQNKTWGFILASLMLIKGFTYGLVLTVGTILLAMKDIKDPLLPAWILITTGGLAGFLFLFSKANVSSST